MNNDDLKKIQKLIKDELRPVKDLVEISKKKVDNQELYLRTTSRIVTAIQDQQSVMNEKLDEHTKILGEHSEILNKHSEILNKHSEILNKHSEKLESLWEQTAKLSVGMEEIKGIVEIQNDLHKGTNGNIKKLGKRMEILEHQAGIIAPPEFTLVNTQ
ncbi:MAG: hypothetical protein Q7R43_01355 [Candidatus Daviesbacteria bacterium]|nr:hypothetical protein [Candidatus Daviesbacteria bacterium]